MTDRQSLEFPVRKPTDRGTESESASTDESLSMAAIYARTSKSKPDFHYSIEEQVSQCWERCEQKGWQVVFVFADESESGTNTERPEFRSMIEMAEEGHFDVVVFWALDRFCRSLTDLIKTEESLDGWGVALHSVTEFLDTSSPVGRFNFRNLASAAELESDLTSKRVRMGMHGMAKMNKWPNRSPPIGYDLKEDRTLSVNESEAQLVCQIFQKYLDVKSMPEIAHWLNKQGIPTKQGGEWSRWAVKQVLSNELYQGHYEVADYEEQVEEYRILSDELFEAVTEARYRFQAESGEMESTRKQSKAEKVLGQFKAAREQTK